MSTTIGCGVRAPIDSIYGVNRDAILPQKQWHCVPHFEIANTNDEPLKIEIL